MNRTVSTDQGNGPTRIVGLSTEAISIQVAPAFGARILSLRDDRRSREWLWQPSDSRGLCTNTLGDSFAQSPLAGIDECLPTISPCVWENRALPDHGECWSQPWELDENLLQEGCIRTSLNLPISPLSFTRMISVNYNEVTLDYTLTSRSSRAESFLWSLHPLLRLEPGDRIDLPDQPGTPRLITAHPPVAEASLDLLQPAGPAQSWIKAFVRAANGQVALCRNDGARLVFHWNSAQLPWLGIWITRGGWNSFHHVALEPCHCPQDNLLSAAQTEFRAPLISSSQTLRWCIRIIVA